MEDKSRVAHKGELGQESSREAEEHLHTAVCPGDFTAAC